MTTSFLNILSKRTTMQILNPQTKIFNSFWLWIEIISRASSARLGTVGIFFMFIQTDSSNKRW